MGVTLATVNAVIQITKATVAAGLGVVQAASTGNPIAVANATTDGAANVAAVTEQTTIGQQQKYFANESTAQVIVARSPSIAVAANQGRREIANAIRPSEELHAAAQNTTAVEPDTTTMTPALTKQPTGPIRGIVTQVRTEVRTGVKDIRSALGGGVTKRRATR